MQVLFRLFLFIFLVISYSGHANTIDSIKNELNKSLKDTTRIRLLNDLSWELLYIDENLSERYSHEALQLSEKIGFKKGIADALMITGVINDNNGNYKESLKNYLKALQIRQEIDDKQGVASAMNNIGTVYYSQGDYNQAGIYYLKAIDVNKSIDNQNGMASVYNNLGMIYEDQGNDEKALFYYIEAQKIYSRLGKARQNSMALNHIGNIYNWKGNYQAALDYYNKALEIHISLNNNEGKASVYNNIAIVYQKQGKIQETLDYYKNALRIYQSINSKEGTAEVLNNIGSVYQEMGNNSMALDHFQKASELNREINNMEGLAIALYNLGTVYQEMRNYSKALDYFSQSMDISKSIDFKKKLSNNYGSISETYAAMGNYKLAYEFHQKYLELYNIIYNKEFADKIAEMQTKYESENQQKEIELLKKEQALKDSELKRSRLSQYLLFGGIIILFFIVMLVSYAYRQKQKTNTMLTLHNAEISQHKEQIEAQRDEIEYQRNQIEIKNKNITDSIRYARRIQHAILPGEEQLKNYFPKSFILYIPKDIVSGDFYWIEKQGNNTYIALVDCTGHGVPGAFMSIVGSNLLNQALKEFKIVNPVDILNHINNSINFTFFNKSDKSDVKVGMDLVICKIDSINKQIDFAGSLCTFYLIRDGQLNVYKGDHFPLGTSATKDLSTYKTYTISSEPNDILYLFSDGFYDQFGGPNKKKFLSKNFQSLILANHEKEMEEQKEELEKTFANWKGNLEQTDDVLVIGLKL